MRKIKHIGFIAAIAVGLFIAGNRHLSSQDDAALSELAKQRTEDEKSAKAKDALQEKISRELDAAAKENQMRKKQRAELTQRKKAEEALAAKRLKDKQELTARGKELMAEREKMQEARDRKKAQEEKKLLDQKAKRELAEARKQAQEALKSKKVYGKELTVKKRQLNLLKKDKEEAEDNLKEEVKKLDDQRRVLAKQKAREKELQVRRRIEEQREFLKRKKDQDAIFQKHKEEEERLAAERRTQEENTVRSLQAKRKQIELENKVLLAEKEKQLAETRNSKIQLAKKDLQGANDEALKKLQSNDESLQKKLDEIAKKLSENKIQEELAARQLTNFVEEKVSAAKRKEKEDEEQKAKDEKKAIVVAMKDAQGKERAEEETKLKRIEALWREGKMYYSKGMYDEAIAKFNMVVELEGNPRIRYTPQAKELIEKAKDKIDDKKQTDLEKSVEKSDKELLREVQQSQVLPYVEPPRELISSIQPAFLLEVPPIRQKLKKSITLDFSAVALKSCFEFVSQETKVSIVASNKVLEQQLKVTANFKDISAEEVIKYIVKSLGLQYRIDKDVVWVALPEEMANEPAETRVYYLNKGGGLFTEFSPMGAGSTETALGGSSATITKISTLEDTIKEAVPWPTDSKLYYDKRINALIVHNTPTNLQVLEDMLYNLDVTPFQILIEAKFIEIDVSDTLELGLDWKFNTEFPLKKKGGNMEQGLLKNSGVDFSSFARMAEGMNLTYAGLLTDPQYQIVMHALAENKKIKTLSSPRITTLNNQQATIKVVDEWIYPTRYEFQVVQTDNGNGNTTTRYQNVPMDFIRRDVGILLKVIPSVGNDRKTISLSLIPEVSSAVADKFVYSGDVKLPQFTSRNLSTTIVVNSGDTVVLGGMIKETSTKTLTKTPILGDIPLLGMMFRKKVDSIERKNLLIFVTARLLSADGKELYFDDKALKK